MHFLIQTIDILEKDNSAGLEIASKLMRDCQCTLNTAYFTEGYFSCDSKEKSHAIYRAKLSSTVSVTSSRLIELLQEWVSSGTASLTLDNIQLYLDPSCKVEIDSFSDPLCSFEVPTTETSDEKSLTEQKTQTTSNNITTYIIIILVVVAVAMVMIVVVICALFIFQRIHFGYVCFNSY